MWATEILQSIGTCLSDITLSEGLVMGLLMAGLVGGATHCVVMCGPFVLSQAGQVEKMRHATLLPYHLGRITTYIGLAMLLHSVLNLAFLFLPIRSLIIAPILMVSGLIFLVSALPSLGKVFPWVGRIGLALPYKWLSNGVTFLSKGTGMIRRYLMGVLLGVMPCGMIVSALMAATTAPSIFEAGIAMAAFGLGTMPALVILALGGKTLGVRFPNIMPKVTQGAMVLSGVWLFVLAGMLLV